MRAIECFLAQSYENKELILLYEEGDMLTQSVIEKYADHDNIFIHCEDVNPKKSLGQLRNLAIEKCSGTYFCQWDDDDWHSAYRLEKQVANLSNYKSNVLDQWFLYNSISGQAYLSGRRRWEGSILCHKDAFIKGVQYDSIQKGEDTIVVEDLNSRGVLREISYPYLYIYVYDGNNTWDGQHWNGIFSRAIPISRWGSEDISWIINGKYPIEEASYRLMQLYFSLVENR